MEKQLVLLFFFEFTLPFIFAQQISFNDFVNTSNSENVVLNKISDTRDSLVIYWLQNSHDRRNIIKYCSVYIQKLVDNTYDAKRQVNKKENEIFNVSEYKSSLQNKIENYLKPLVHFLQLDTEVENSKLVEIDLSYIENSIVNQIVYNYYFEKTKEDIYQIPNSIIENNLKILAKRLEINQHIEFVSYQSPVVSNRIFKAVDFNLDNDFFLRNGNNQDREYTGGGSLTFYTDYLKWRWFNIGWFSQMRCNNQKNNYQINNNILTHQSVKIGMHFYTPYIRYRNNFKLADTLYKQDRPFASYAYIERSKYRLWPKGLIRHHGTFQIGILGSYLGRDIQARLHQDVTVASQKVYGWENQISNGGTWIYQINHEFDILLFSTTNRFASVISANKLNKMNSKSKINFFQSVELKYGGYLTSIGSGLHFSILDFTKQSGQNVIAIKKSNLYDFGFNVEYGLNYRYVIHNSLLEGFGYTNTYPDDPYDNESTSRHVLSKNTINRNLLIFDAKLNIRFRKMIVYYAMNLSSKEYKIADLDYLDFEKYLEVLKDKDYFINEVIPALQKFNRLKYYGYGQLGLVWLID